MPDLPGFGIPDKRPEPPEGGYRQRMRIRNVDVRPLGGGLGCLVMILVSVVLSLVLTFCANALIR